MFLRGASHNSKLKTPDRLAIPVENLAGDRHNCDR